MRTSMSVNVNYIIKSHFSMDNMHTFGVSTSYYIKMYYKIFLKYIYILYISIIR